MKHALTLTPIASAFLLASCGVSAPVRPLPPPPSLVEPCAAPVALPERDVTQGEVETWWGRDRSALRACGEKHAALAAYVTRTTNE